MMIQHERVRAVKTDVALPAIKMTRPMSAPDYCLLRVTEGISILMIPPYVSVHLL